MKGFEELILNDNYFTVYFPSSFCPSTITALTLNFNFLSGQLAIKECQLHLYRSLNITLQGNFFTGPLQNIFDVTQHHSFYELSLSGNQLTGTIPGLIFFNFPNLKGFNNLKFPFENEFEILGIFPDKRFSSRKRIEV